MSLSLDEKNNAKLGSSILHAYSNTGNNFLCFRMSGAALGDIGDTTGSSIRKAGSVDKFALFSRALPVAEILSLSKRDATYFSEGDHTGAALFSPVNFFSTLVGQYLQYEVTLDTIDTSLSPRLKKVVLRTAH